MHKLPGAQFPGSANRAIVYARNPFGQRGVGKDSVLDIYTYKIYLPATMSRSSRTHFAVLGFLSRKPMSAYEIKTTLEQGSTRHFWRESFGQLYPALKRMEDEGLVRGEDDPTAGGRPRRVYEITDAGMRAFVAWLGEQAAPEPVRQELLLKLYFGRLCGPAVCRNQVQTLRAESESLLESYEAIAETLEDKWRDHPDMPYWRMTLRFGISRCEATRDWCVETLVELDKLATKPTAAKAKREQIR